MPKTSPTGWVYLRSGDCTIRWQRGDKMAYIFEGKQLETFPDESPKVKVIDTIPVYVNGWTDVQDIRLAGERWLKSNSKQRCPTCGRVA